ncbi:MAG: hypothetical protein MJ014_01600 [Methanocorpusculum sp.]|nr:hypothetical protein [Methanocorpusculum sp.]
MMFYVGDYVTKGDQIRETLRMLGKILHEDARAEEIIAYFGTVENDLRTRVSNVSDAGKPTVYACDISYNGGMEQTEPIRTICCSSCLAQRTLPLASVRPVRQDVQKWPKNRSLPGIWTGSLWTSGH